eukprot:g2304.t1
MRLREWLNIPTNAPPAFKASEDGDVEEEYCTFMSKNGNWGGMLELIAAASVMRKNIVVLEADRDDKSSFFETYRTQAMESAGTVYVFYDGSAHYDEVSPLKEA